MSSSTVREKGTSKGTKSQTAERMDAIAEELAGVAADMVSAFGHSGRWAQTLERCARELLDLAENLPIWIRDELRDP